MKELEETVEMKLKRVEGALSKMKEAYISFKDQLDEVLKEIIKDHGENAVDIVSDICDNLDLDYPETTLTINVTIPMGTDIENITNTNGDSLDWDEC